MPTSLGRKCFTDELVAETVFYQHLTQLPSAGSDHHVQTSYLTIGDHTTRNACQMRQKGSLVMFKYTKHLQATAIATTMDSGDITLTTAQAHGLSPGDTIYLSAPTGLPFSGIDASMLEKSHILIAGSTGTTLIFALTGASAGQTGSYANFTADIDVVIYKYMDMANGDTSFTRSTTEPNTSYENLAVA